MSKTMNIAKYVFTIVGLGLLIGSIFAYQNSKSFIEGATTTEGVVTELIRSRSSDSNSDYYKPVFEFMTSKGETVEIISSTGSNPPSYSEGEKIKILYMPSDPQSAKIDSFTSLWLLPLILAIIGGVFFIIGGLLVIMIKLKNKKEQYLLKHGEQIETNFQNIELNKSLEINGRNPYYIISQWLNPVTSELHIFKSNNIWFDPSDHINEQSIKVFIDRNNPKQYLMDISFLPKVS